MKNPKSAVVASSARPGRWSTRSPTRRQIPSRRSSSSSGRQATAELRGQKPRRPTIVRRAGSSVRPASSAAATPIADTGPSALVDPVSASSSTSIAAIDRAPARQHGGAGASQRARHRLVLVLDAVQLLAVAADEQQAVVGAHAEHQHHEDPGRVRVDGVAGLGVQVDEAGGEEVGEPDHEDRNEGDQRRPVDRTEEDQNEQDGGEQQLGVELAEDLLEVHPQPEVAGDVDLEPVAAPADHLAAFLAPVGDPVEVERDRDDGVSGVAVLRHEARRRVRLEGHLSGLGDRDRLVDLPRVLGDLLPVGLGEAAFALVDEQPDRRLAAGEALLQELLDLGRLRFRGEEARGLVGGDIRELGPHRSHHHGRDEPEKDDDPLGAAAGDEGGERGHGSDKLASATAVRSDRLSRDERHRKR